MIRAIRLFREYRRQGLRRAWRLSGMPRFSRQVAAGFIAGASIVSGIAALSSQAQAIQEAADNRVAARVSSQAGEIEALRRLLSSCLGDKEGALFIGGELYLCRAVPTGIRM